MNVILRLLAALLLLSVPLFHASSAAAQAEGLLLISKPDTSAFPTIQFELDAHNAQGRFLNNLKSEDLWLVENGKQIKPETIRIVQNGLQVIIALNTSPWMASQNSEVTGYQQIQQAMSTWAESQPANTPDDVSLSTATGLFLIRERQPDRVVRAINEYQPDILNTQPTLGSLAEAIDLATDPLGRPSMKRVILYITPALPSVTPETMDDLVSRARGTGARVHVWMIAPAGAQSGTANPLQALSDATGGEYQEISLDRDAPPLPQIEPLLEPLRNTYQISYTSQIQQGGSQRLSVEMRREPLQMESNEVRFDLDVQPPNPMFISPPAAIERTASSGDLQALTPERIPLQILVEFPDNHQRPLQATRLYVNGQVIAENTSPPFDSFEWPLQDLTTSGRHLLRVEAVDSQGLSGTSIETPVEVMVPQPAQANLSARVSGKGMIAIGAIAAAGIALGLVLAFTGGRRHLTRKRSLIEKRKDKDPVTQPVKIKQETSKGKKDKSTPVRSAPGWPAWKHSATPAAPARLVFLNESEEPITGGVLPLTRQEITFGTDPKRATQVLDSATVDGLHARLYREDDGQFFLCDQNSTAGTWINYAPVTTSGALLEHGDLIHIGKVMFRFEMTEPKRVPVVEVQVLDQEP